MKKTVIGLTGLYCAGKNHIALLLEKRGLPVLDLDKLGHHVIETEKKQIVERFGNDILSPQGFIDRKLLGARVFNKSEELADLENIIHPAVNRETIEWIAARKEKGCVINAALLHRSSALDLLDAVIIVEAPFLIRLFRAKKRDKLPWTALLKRFHSQSKFSPKFFEGKTDIYRVSNPSGCAAYVFLGFKRRYLRKKPENRIDEILSLMGI